MKKTIPDWMSRAMEHFPSHVCAGVCEGNDWTLLACNSAVSDFFRRHDPVGNSSRAKAGHGAGDSLFTLFCRAGMSAAVNAIRSAEKTKTVNFTIQRHSYSFVWTVAASGDAENSLYFFFFHAADQSPGLSEYEDLSRELQAIIDSMHDGIWVIDGKGLTVHVNKAMKRIADIDPDAVIGKHVSEPMKDGKFSSCVTLTALEEKRPVTLFDDYACGARCLNTSMPIFDDDGNVWRVVASIRDMTELESLQKRLAEAELAAHIYRGKLDSMQRNRAPGFIANSAIMRNCLRELEKAAKAPSGILLLGETGTGKTLAASIIHQKSLRCKKPFITINCAAIPPTLIESELFGYERGAFTGAGNSGKKGFFEQADKGSILLDEIGDFPLNIQAKLLQVLDNQTFHKVGGEKSVKVDVRVIAASNRPLEQLVAAGEFRADLYYRLRVLSVRMPPLREHREDISELAMIFLEEACKRHGAVKTFSPRVLRCFAGYPWPGNVRELRAAVEFTAAMTEGSIIRLTDLPPHICAGNADAAATTFSCAKDDREQEDRPRELRAAVRALEKTLISKALSRSGSSYKAAKMLGVSQSTVVRKAHQLGIAVKE